MQEAMLSITCCITLWSTTISKYKFCQTFFVVVMFFNSHSFVEWPIQRLCWKCDWEVGKCRVTWEGVPEVWQCSSPGLGKECSVKPVCGLAPWQLMLLPPKLGSLLCCLLEELYCLQYTAVTQKKSHPPSFPTVSCQGIWSSHWKQ